MYDNNGDMMMAFSGGSTDIYGWRQPNDLQRYRDTINGVGTAICGYWTSSRFKFGSATYFKHFRELFAVISTYGIYDSDMKISFEIDFIDIENILEVKDRITVWGRARFGERFIVKDIAASLPTQIGRRGRFMSFTVANDIIDQPIRIHEIAGDYILRGRRS